MAGKKTHQHIDFDVESQGQTYHFKSFDEAAAQAVAMASSTDEDVLLDVLCYSKAGAKWWGGADAVEVYEDDPEASVFQRFVITAVNQGRIA